MTRGSKPSAINVTRRWRRRPAFHREHCHRRFGRPGVRRRLRPTRQIHPGVSDRLDPPGNVFGEAFGHALTTGTYSKCWPRSRLAKTNGLGSLWYSSGDTIPNSEKLSMVSADLLVYRKLDSPTANMPGATFSHTTQPSLSKLPKPGHLTRHRNEPSLQRNLPVNRCRGSDHTVAASGASPV